LKGHKKLPSLLQFLTGSRCRLGIPRKTVVVAGGGDNAASAISMGITEVGQAFLSLGTSGVYFVADNEFRPNPTETLAYLLPLLARALASDERPFKRSQLFRLVGENITKNH